MGVFAHPDDETGIAGTLAHYALGRKAVCANVYCTRGEGGGNMVGTQWGDSLGILREAELRDCLATIGVRYCYFLNQPDWAYTESAAATLEKWGKDRTLERLVRMVRSLRPEVIVTMNPAPTPGQHGHHQSAGILATEAFDAAADPLRFPQQIALEGLKTWQVRKLYYGGSNAPTVAIIDLSEKLSTGRYPGEVAGLALAHHRSQAFGNFGGREFRPRPQTFTLVKSVVPFRGIETNLLQGLPIAADAPRRIEIMPPPQQEDVSFEFISRPAFRNYHQWVQTNGIQHVAKRYGVDLPMAAGRTTSASLQIVNQSADILDDEVLFSGPEGWVFKPSTTRLSLQPGKTARIAVMISVPAGWQGDADFAAKTKHKGREMAANARGHVVPFAKVPKVSAVQLVESAKIWEGRPSLVIASTNLAQGKTSSEADSSALFYLGHDKKNLYVDVLVKDDQIVSNIAPDDIRGHWRSDSVEICIDPDNGSEHTLRSYKIGVFPFDSTGRVRAARDADAKQGLIEQTAPGTRISALRTSDGYRIQAKIPFSEAGVTYSKGRQIGFNIIVYDGDKKDAAPGENINKSRIAWAPRSGVQGRPEDWGRLELE